MRRMRKTYLLGSDAVGYQQCHRLSTWWKALCDFADLQPGEASLHHFILVNQLQQHAPVYPFPLYDVG